MRNGHINNVKKDQAIDKSLINYNLIINNLNTHHNKETKLLRVNASRLSWIPRISKQAYRPVLITGCSAERVINSARKHVWVRFAHIKRDGVPLVATQSLELELQGQQYSWTPWIWFSPRFTLKWLKKKMNSDPYIRSNLRLNLIGTRIQINFWYFNK